MDNLHTDNARKQIFDCIIIGGGISGISFAHKLSTIDKNILLLEKEGITGGQIQTYNSKKSPEYWSELGAHTCYNSYTSLLSIISESQLEDEIVSLDRCKYVLYDNNKIKSVTSQLSYLPLMFCGLRIFGSSKKGKTVREYFKPIVGSSNYEKVFRNMFRAVISQDADEYPAESFLKRRKDRREDIPRKYSFRKGLLSFLNLLIEKDPINVRINTEITGITKGDDNLYHIHTKEGEILYALNIAIATNPQIASRLLKNVDNRISKILETIPLFQSETLNIIINKKDIDLQKLAGIIPTSGGFLSAVSRDVYEHPELRSFSFHFYGNEKSEDEKLETVCQVLGIKKKNITEHSFTSHTLPSLRVEHTDIIQRINEAREQEHIFLTGNYFYGLSLEDCVHRSIDEFKRFQKVN